jgi:hypothetical protein
MSNKLAATFHGAEIDPASGMTQAELYPNHPAQILAERGREQALRAHVADLLTDVEHFAGCHRWVEGDGTCTCLIGRLDWAINADVHTPESNGAA